MTTGRLTMEELYLTVRFVSPPISSMQEGNIYEYELDVQEFRD